MNTRRAMMVAAIAALVSVVGCEPTVTTTDDPAGTRVLAVEVGSDAAKADAPAAGELVLAANGASEYVVVVSAEASESEKWAASELVDHIEQMSEVVIPVTAETGAIPAKAIIIGDGKAARELGVDVAAADVGDEGFVIKTVGQRLVIAGGRQRGTMYGVFDLLERLGCRWWYPGEMTIPKLATIAIGPIDDRQTPALEYRGMLYGEQGGSEQAMLWRARNRVNDGWHKDMKPEYGGSYKFYQLVHSYGSLLPPSEHFEKHPEYYALVKGERNTGQICFSNDEVVKLVAAAVEKIIAEHPEYEHVTVGQNDNNNYCRCEPCKALADKYDSRGGMQLDFAKRVGAIVWEEYPEAIINVPAYRWSRKAPKGIVPDKRMTIALCSIECNFGQPLAEGYPEQKAAFKADIEGWSAIAPKLLIWDYTTNFTHYIAPYPNYYVLVPNVKFFVDNKVRGIMHQGSHTTKHGQLAPLVMWVLAKAMWNPDIDGREAVREFCMGYYGPKAGPLVLEYLNLLHEGIAKDRLPIWCTRGTYINAAFLSADRVAKAEKLFQQAEATVADEANLLRRVRIAHVPIQRAMLMRPRKLWPAANELCGGLDFKAYCRQFAATGREAGISRAAEGDSVKQLFDWADDYGKLRGDDLTADLPAELRDVDAERIHLVQAAQMTRQVRWLVPAAGATDGWAQKVVSSGWTIQHRIAPPLDTTPGAKYRLFIRARGKPKEGATGNVFSAGVHVSDGKRTSRGIKAEELNGQWQTFEIGVMTATPKGGSFYIALDSENKVNVSDVQLDCLWLVAEESRAP